MSAPWVLGSIGILLALLIHGRIKPGILFTGLASLYYLLGLIDQRSFLASFGNPALVTLVLVLIVSLALERTPWLDRLSDAILKGNPTLAGLRLTGTAALASAFINNTAVVGTFLSVVMRQRHIPPSRLLIPLSYASIVGGVTTLVGTSTNMVVNSLVVGAGMPPLGMFSFAWVGVPVAIACLLVMMLTSRLLPTHTTDDDAVRQSYFLEAQVQADSPLVGRNIEENKLRNLDGLFLLEIARGEVLISPVSPNERIQTNDVLVFTGEVTKVQALQRFPGLQLFGHGADTLLRSNLAEVVISNESDLANKTLRDVDFRTMFDAGVVGIRRGDKRLEGQLGRVPLKVGDSLLLAVGADFAQHRNIDRNFHVLQSGLLRPRLTNRQSHFALSGFAAVIMLSALDWLPLLNGLIILLAAFLLSGLLTLSEIRRRFPFDLVLIIGSALTIARVLEDSGAAQLMAGALDALFAGAGVLGAMAGVYLLTLLLTELISNNAAAALAFPIALSTARHFGVEPLPFVMLVAYGASAGFMVPFGYQTHLMVYSPGRYRLMDFVKSGLPVSITYSITVLILTFHIYS